MSVSEQSTIHKFPAECKEGHHKWSYQYAKYTDMDDDKNVDTYFGDICKVCKEIKR
jgi:hypothetical protein